MDMHRAFRIAENLYADDGLSGIDYVGIGFDPSLANEIPGDDGYIVELFSDMNDDRNTPDHVIRTESDLDKFWVKIAQDIEGVLAT